MDRLDDGADGTGLSLPPRRWLLRAGVALVVVALLVPAGISAATFQKRGFGPGTVTQPADDTTIVGIQGFHFSGYDNPKKPARLAAANGSAGHRWTYSGGRRGTHWFYDVDPLPDGNLLVVSTVPGDTVVFEFDPETKERVWSERFDATDTHDVDLINGDQLLFAEKSRYDESVAKSGDRVFIYDRGEDEVVWEYVFRNHYSESTDGGQSEDWTHVNDVDRVADGRYLVSPRNFDQVILLDRETKETVWRLGADDEHDVLHEQHNPDHLEGPDGEPTVLVADSENDRVVEYACVGDAADPVAGSAPDCEWTEVWSVSGFNWPRDADRLPNGNTLVTDSLNHRVVEVTPEGEVVWEFYAPWAPYDSERPKYGDGSNGSTMREMDASGAHEVHGGAGEGPTARTTFSEWVTDRTAGTPAAGEVKWLLDRYRHVTPFVKPVWLSTWAFASTLGAVLVLLGWGTVEGVYHRRRIRRRLGAVVGRLRPS
jgi:hypothetical protein